MGLEPGPTASEPCSPTYFFTWEPLEFLTNISEILKKCLARQKLEPGPTASEPCCPTYSAMGSIAISDKGQ